MCMWFKAVESYEAVLEVDPDHIEAHRCCSFSSMDSHVSICISISSHPVVSGDCGVCCVETPSGDLPTLMIA